jgi:hypothetical protein
MPRATADTTETSRHDLKSCPPDGFILVRRLTYGEKLERRAMVSNMKIDAQKGKKDFSGEMQLVNEQATIFDFQKCVVDHNLEDAEGNKLNLHNIGHVKMLDPRIGEEIDQILSDLNNFEEDEGE